MTIIVNKGREDSLSKSVDEENILIFIFITFQTVISLRYSINPTIISLFKMFSHNL